MCVSPYDNDCNRPVRAATQHIGPSAAGPEVAMTPFCWSAEHVAAAARAPGRQAPVLTREQVRDVLPGHDVWDHWPALLADGALALIDGGLLVVALTAPIRPDPDDRHALARLRLFHAASGVWRDLGDALPDGWSPGSREWAGSALLEPESRRLTLFFTAAGHRGEAVPSYAQRLFATRTVLDATARPTRWGPLCEIVRPDGVTYETELRGGGGVGTVKAFRDPFFFRDPDGSDDWMLFAASRAGGAKAWNGLIGAGRREGRGWRLAQPWVDATGTSNELERPHAITHAGRVYLFWCTQAAVFAPSASSAPTGLYGIVADRLGEPWRPLNGDTLVLSNPNSAPRQAYSWQVLPDLSVWSFTDLIGCSRPPAGTADVRRAFGGGPAPVLRLILDNADAALVG